MYRVEQVINGHTWMLSDDKKVRLIGIDASSDEATEFVRQLVEGRGIKLEFDDVREDEDGTLLAYALMIETFINATVVHAGYAIPDPHPVNDRHDEMFESLYLDARTQKRGLWRQ